MKKKSGVTESQEVTPLNLIKDPAVRAELGRIWRGEVQGGISSEDCLNGLSRDKLLLKALKGRQVSHRNLDLGFKTKNRTKTMEYLKQSIKEWEIGYGASGHTFALNLDIARRLVARALVAA